MFRRQREGRMSLRLTLHRLEAIGFSYSSKWRSNLLMDAKEAMSSVSGRPQELAIHTRNVDGGQVQVTVEDSGVVWPRT